MLVRESVLARTVTGILSRERPASKMLTRQTVVNLRYDPFSSIEIKHESLGAAGTDSRTSRILKFDAGRGFGRT